MMRGGVCGEWYHNTVSNIAMDREIISSYNEIES